MKREILYCFIIILLCLVLFYFFVSKNNTNYYNTGEGFIGKFSGIFETDINPNNQSNTTIGNYDNYNHFSKTSTQLQNGTTYTNDNGGVVIVTTNTDGSQTLKVTLNNSASPIYFTSKPPTTLSTDNSANDVNINVSETFTNLYGYNGSATIFYGPNNSRATVINTNSGQEALRVKTDNGTYTYTKNNSYYNPNNSNITNTQYYGSTGNAINPTSYSLAYQEPYTASAGSVTGLEGNTAYYATGPQGNTVVGSTSTQNTNNYDYSNSLPQGIPKGMIPSGQEDLYILKSEVVPPVCPVCPTCLSSSSNQKENCPPCPACARCPEPSFECKKVPNYNAINDEYMPSPFLNDFSKFGR